MEVAGFEPASEREPITLSTSVFGRLDLAAEGAANKAPKLPAPKIPLRPAEQPDQGSLHGDLIAAAGKLGCGRGSFLSC